MLKFNPQHYNIPNKDFFLQDTCTVAKNLIGMLFIKKEKSTYLVGRITETEAYHENEESCHAHRGRTPRNEVMFLEGGRLYVYFTYGMHYCMNIVTEREGVAAAVLIRAFKPLFGIEQIRKNRNYKPDKILTNGPGKCCQAFNINKDMNNQLLYNKNSSISIVYNDIHTKNKATNPKIEVTKRIGISKAKDLLWRFVEI